MRKYRINKHPYNHAAWCVEVKRKWFPFWTKVGQTHISTREEAQELCDLLNANN